MNNDQISDAETAALSNGDTGEVAHLPAGSD